MDLTNLIHGIKRDSHGALPATETTSPSASSSTSKTGSAAEPSSTNPYDLHADLFEYESLRDQDRSGLEAFTARLAPGAKLLDAGCGAGHDLLWLARKGFHVDGIDSSEQMIARAATRLSSLAGLPGASTTNLATGPATASPAPSLLRKDLRFASLTKESLDGIWCSQVLQHLTIDECHRVLAIYFQALRPRTGLLFASFLLGEESTDDAPVDPATTRFKDEHGRSFHRFTEKAFHSLLRQSGFTAVLQGTRADAANPDRVWAAVLAQRA